MPRFAPANPTEFLRIHRSTILNIRREYPAHQGNPALVSDCCRVTLGTATGFDVGTSSLVGPGSEVTGPLNDVFYAAMRFSNAIRLGMTRVQPFCWIRCCFLKPAKSRLTVSREVPIICPISS